MFCYAANGLILLLYHHELLTMVEENFRILCSELHHYRHITEKFGNIKGGSTWVPKTAKPHKILGRNKKLHRKLGKTEKPRIQRFLLLLNSRQKMVEKIKKPEKPMKTEN